MMQHLAAQKNDLASPNKLGAGNNASSHDRGRGQEFASVFDQNRHIAEANERGERQAIRDNETRQASKRASSEKLNSAKEADKRRDTEVLEAEKQADAYKQETSRTEQNERSSADKPSSNNAESSSQEASEHHSDEADWSAKEAEQAGDVSGDEQIGEPAPDEQGGEVASKPAEHFDWLTMLDKIYGQSRGAIIETDGTTPPPETDIPADISQLSDLQKALKDIVNSQSQTLEEVSEQIVGSAASTDNTLATDEATGEAEGESLADILSLIDALKSQDEVSEEELAKLDQMIDEFIDTKPELAGSALKELSGGEWLKLDTKLVANVLQTPITADKAAESLDEVLQVTDTLARQIAKAEPEQVQKVAEYVAQQILPKDASPELKESFVEKLKAGLEDLKSQLKQGDSAADVAQVVKDALASVTDVNSSVNVEQAKLQQVLSVASSSLEVSSQLTEQKQLVAETSRPQSTSTVSAKELNTAQLEASRQQQAAQMDKTVNMHKPEAPQHLAEKVQVMVNQKNMVAEIRLDPPDLGGMKIKLNMTGDAASVNFVVQTQHAREALEQATPRLKELLDEQGIELGQSSVQQESNQQGEAGDGQLADGRGGNGDGSSELEEDVPEVQTIQMVNGSVNGIDYFA
ncbi:flagellar hook-length control protein FliK [Alteromonas sp. a30]|uniref:flagellar hook-length control protein FliK n=1 Tax=Alteromonas sp. a30 TaxID=2730917 RepID=UPI0022831D5A|nr:flagellar hook-length control protein FliK [Alteromonas sp. a30]MCY7294428.1 hypothetical protein [Alteromonas sp. a30]